MSKRSAAILPPVNWACFLADAFSMRALSIRQPYAELILRGIKTIEYRSRRTRIIGERFYIYAARTPGDAAGFAELGCEPGDPGTPPA